MGGPGEPLDKVRREIEAEARRRRIAGEIDPSVELELEAAFAQYAPMSAKEANLDASLRSLGAATLIDAHVPVASNFPLGLYFKRLMRKAMFWYLNYLAQQVRSLGLTTLGSIHALTGRLVKVEEHLGLMGPVDPVSAGEISGFELGALGELGGAVCAALAGSPGRVLHAECGNGWLLSQLVAAGIDAYGVDPRAEVVAEVLAEGLDAWDEPADVHLASLGPAAVSAVVLSGVTDRLPVVAKTALMNQAAASLAPGGKLVVLSASPERWRESASPLEVDLSPGVPLHPETWEWLMGNAGLEVERLSADSSDPGAYGLVGTLKA